MSGLPLRSSDTAGAPRAAGTLATRTLIPVPLSSHLRERILRQIDSLSDEKGYAVLDYVEFIASRHGTPAPASANIFTRFAEGVEDTMRAGKVSTQAIAQTMGLLNQAVGVLSGVAAAGKSVASDIVTTASDVAKTVTGGAAGAGGQGGPADAGAPTAPPPQVPPSSASPTGPAPSPPSQQ